MIKAKIIDNALETVILQERNVLAKFNFPFVVNMLCSFQNKNNLFIVTELLTGGDLQFHIVHYKYYFSETQLKFLITNLILGLEYIHKKGIVHSNLSTSNIMFDSRGFSKIIGFGSCCVKDRVIDDKILQLGASEYMAPEVFNKEKLDFTADFYSLGAVAYKLICGKKFRIDEDENKNLIKDKKLRANYSEFCLDFIMKLLKRNPKDRLGGTDYETEIKGHDFLMGMKWDLIKKRIYISPNQDIVEYSKIQNEYPELFDYDLCNNSKDETTPQEIQNYIEIAEGEAYPMYFQYFTSMRVENILRELNKDDDEYKLDDYWKEYKQMKNNMKKSKSSLDITSSNNNNNKNKKHHQHHYHHYHPHQHHDYHISKQKNEQSNISNIYKLPFISNTEKARLKRKEREEEIKDYYENKLFKYKDYLNKLKSDYKHKSVELDFLQAKYLDPIDYQFQQIFPFNYRPLSYLPNIYQGNNKKEIYNDMKKNNYKMNKVMARFLDKMSKDRNNFFIKYNKNNHLDKKEDDDDDSSSYSSDYSDVEGTIKYYGNPYYNPYKPHNPKFFINANNNMMPRYVKDIGQSEESDESEGSTNRYVVKGNNGFFNNKGYYQEVEDDEDDDDEES